MKKEGRERKRETIIEIRPPARKKKKNRPNISFAEFYSYLMEEI